VSAVLLAAVLWALADGVIGGFLAASLTAGIAQGAAQTGGMRSLLPDTHEHERAGLLSTIFLINYASAAVPNMVAGRFADTFSLVQIGLAYSVLVTVGVVVALVFAQNPRPRRLTDEA